MASDQPMWKTDANGQQVLADNYQGLMGGIPRSTAEAFLQAQQQPGYAQASANRAQETNAYQTARDAALGMMNPGSMGANGVDYGKAQSDPSSALRAFDASGYTGQQAQADGWGTGVGSPGWQSTPQSQHLNPDGGNMAAMSPQDPNWGRQLTPSIAQQLGGGQQGQSGGQQQGGIYQQLGAMLGPQGPSASSPRYGAGYGQQQSGGQGGNPYAALTGPMQSSAQQYPQQGGNPFGALSSYLGQRSQGGYNTHPQQAQMQRAPVPGMGPAAPVPLSSMQHINPSALSSLASQLNPPRMGTVGSYQPTQPHQLGIMSSLGSQLGGLKAPGA